MSYSVVILAGGEGKRMKSTTPKVLHQILNKPMLGYIIDKALKVCSNIGVVLYHNKDLIQNYINSNFSNIQIYTQDYKRFPGTAGAIMGVEFTSKRLLLLNADMPLITQGDLEKLMNSNAAMAVGIVNKQDPTGYGRAIIKNAKLEAIVEEKDATDTQKQISWVNGGVYSFDTDFLKTALGQITNSNAQNEYYITDLVQIAIAQNKSVEPIFCDETSLFGVNSKLELAKAQGLMQERINNYWLENGVFLHNSISTLIDESVVFKGECFVESGCVIKGKTIIQNSTIHANSIVEDAQIIDSFIGPFARIRPNSYINSSKIGNFVETKSSKLTGVKAGHLSYIGDATIEKGTNVGAGMITCNYDGKQKHKTNIGKNVFIGSDSHFVAPINVEDNAIIAAGSTITKDIKEGELAISRTNQTNKAGFFKKFFDA